MAKPARSARLRFSHGAYEADPDVTAGASVQNHLKRGSRRWQCDDRGARTRPVGDDRDIAGVLPVQRIAATSLARELSAPRWIAEVLAHTAPRDDDPVAETLTATGVHAAAAPSVAPCRRPGDPRTTAVPCSTATADRSTTFQRQDATVCAALPRHGSLRDDWPVFTSASGHGNDPGHRLSATACIDVFGPRRVTETCGHAGA